jgi:hypothetical protein
MTNAWRLGDNEGMANDKENVKISKRRFRQMAGVSLAVAAIAAGAMAHADTGGATDFPSATPAPSSGSANGNSDSNSIGTTQTAPPGIETPSQPPYVVNSHDGKIYPKINGGIINPSGGQFYPDVGAGYMNPATGQIIPKQ